MNKELLELLDKINAKKSEVKNLADAGKLDEAKAAKAELQEMQDKFDLLKDIMDAGPEPQNPKPVKDDAHEAEKNFANAARSGFKNVMTEGGSASYTVPKDIQTMINKRRDAEFSLRSLVTVESVTTSSGSRTYMKKTSKVGFSEVGEGAAIGAVAAPEFEQVKYNIRKFAGYLPCTNELLADSDANITSVLTTWLGDQARATDNANIIAAVKTAKSASAVSITGIDDLTRLVNVTLGAAYRAVSRIVTNDNGLQALCELKDANGRPLLNPIPSDPARMQIACGPTVIPVDVIPNEILKNITESENEFIPFIVGSLNDAVHLFDRNSVSIRVSDTAAVTGLNAFENDLTLFRGIIREDVQIVDPDAVVMAKMKVSKG